MKLSNPNDITHTKKTPRERIVHAAVAITNTTPDGGIFVIFRMCDAIREILFFHRRQASEFLGAFRRANKEGHLPPLQSAEHDALVKIAPYPTDEDFNMNNDLSRYPKQIKALVMADAIVFDFIMLDGSSRLFTLPLPLARFLGEYVEQAMRPSQRNKKEQSQPQGRTLH